MKELSFADQADIVQKVKSVGDSVKRNKHLEMYKSYAGIARKAVTNSMLYSEIWSHEASVEARIKNKPRYRFDHSSGRWAETTQKRYAVSLVESISARAQKEISLAQLQAHARYEGWRKSALASLGLEIPSLY